jgi:uncharacterized protein
VADAPVWRRWLLRLTDIPGTSRRVAAAFAFGVFLSFSPFIGFQIITGMTVATLVRWSRAAVFIGLCTNLPWLMIPYYTATTAFGAYLLDVPIAADFHDRLSRLLALPVYRAVFWQNALQLVWPFISAFLLGSTLCAIVIGGATYVAMVPLLERVRRLPRETEEGTAGRQIDDA